MTTAYFHKSNPCKKFFALIQPKQNVAASPRFEPKVAALIARHQAALKIRPSPVYAHHGSNT
jgi:hypothetical protein